MLNIYHNQCIGFNRITINDQLILNRVYMYRYTYVPIYIRLLLKHKVIIQLYVIYLLYTLVMHPTNLFIVSIIQYVLARKSLLQVSGYNAM